MPAEDEGPPKLEDDAEENEDRPCTLDEESRLDLRRELLLRARATDVLLRLNHDPNSVSPPVV